MSCLHVSICCLFMLRLLCFVFTLMGLTDGSEYSLDEELMKRKTEELLALIRQ